MPKTIKQIEHDLFIVSPSLAQIADYFRDAGEDEQYSHLCEAFVLDEDDFTNDD